MFLFWALTSRWWRNLLRLRDQHKRRRELAANHTKAVNVGGMVGLLMQIIHICNRKHVLLASDCLSTQYEGSSGMRGTKMIIQTGAALKCEPPEHVSSLLTLFHVNTDFHQATVTLLTLRRTWAFAYYAFDLPQNLLISYYKIRKCSNFIHK